MVHESDVHSGLVNKIASRYATKTFTGFNHVLPNSITVGQILSDDIIPKDSIIAKGDTHVTIKKDDTFTKVLHTVHNDNRPTVFVMGGSQGSKSLYETFAELLQTNVGIALSFNFFISL